MDLARLSPSLREQVERYKSAATNAREKARELGKVAVQSVETGGTAGLIGYLEGKRAAEGKLPLTILGAPLESALALAGHAAAMTGFVKGSETHARAIADGALAVLAFKKGRSLGERSGPGGGPSLPPG